MNERTRATSRASAWLTQLPAAALLIALAVIPLFANPVSARVHDPERMILLRIFGLIALCAAIATRRPRLPLPWIAGIALYLTGSFFSCFYSVAPTHALAGDYGRQFGLLTDVALVGFLLAGACLERERIELAVRTVLVGGALASVVALGEWVMSRGRVDGLAGGATFLADQIAPLLPLAIAFRRNRLDTLLIVVLALGLLASGTRVAVIAVLIALAMLSLLRGSVVSRKTLLAGFGALGCVLLLALPPLRSLLPEQSLPARIGALFQGNDVSQRTLLWRDSLTAMRAMPTSLLTGNGPDSTGILFTQYVSPELQQQLGGRARVDRFHCDPLDLLFTRGLLGLSGMVLLLAAAFMAARRLALSGDRIALGIFGLLAVATFDALFAVPGAASRLLVFAACGWLASRVANAELPHPVIAEPERGRTRSKVPARETVIQAAGTTWLPPAPILAAMLLTLTHALALPGWTNFAILSLPLRGHRLVIGLYALLVTLAPWLPALLDSSPAGELAWAGSVRILALDAVLIALAIRCAASWRTEPALANVGRGRLASWIVIALVLIVAMRDDLKRQVADVHAAVAATFWNDRDRPDLAAEEFLRASELAPEVDRYRIRQAQSLVDYAERTADESPRELWVKAAEQLEFVYRTKSNDALALTESGDVLLRFAARLGPDRALAVAQALRLADIAGPRAPTSVPVLQLVARIALERGDPQRALDTLEVARGIDQEDPITSLLLGRTMAHRNEIAGAAEYYSEALSGSVGRAEALTGIALAAASQGNIEDAAKVLAEVVDLVPRLRDVRRELEGARPLLRYFGYDTAVATFVRLKELRPDDDRGVAAVVNALRY